MNSATSQEERLAPAPSGISSHLRISSEPTLRDIFMMLKRRRWLIAGIVVLATLALGAVLEFVAPVYTATAKIAMERRGIQITDLQQVASGLPGDESTFANEIEILTSRDLAAQVVDELNLIENSEFNSALRSSRGSNAASAQDRELQRIATVDAFLDHLGASAVGKSSRVVELSFKSHDPYLAARIVNTVAETYIDNQVETKYSASSEANDLLSEQIVTLRAKVEDSERAIEKFRAESGLLEGQDVTFKAQQTAELSSQLVMAEANWAEAEVQYDEAKRLLDSPNGIESAAEVLNSTLIANLRQQQATVERTQADYAKRYGPMHPRMISLDAEAKKLDDTIRQEIEKIVLGYANERRIAKARYDSLRQSLERMEGEVGDANAAAVKLRGLERENHANQTMLEAFLERVTETSTQQDLGMFTPDSKVISKADVPLAPSFPKTKLFLALVLVGSGFFAICLALLLEHLDQGLHSVVDVEEGLGVPLLALVPQTRDKLDPKAPLARYVARNGASAFAHSIRTLYRSLSYSRNNTPVRSVLITSVQPGEGKTTISSCLARVGAKTNSVIVVDADVHRSGLSRTFDAEGGEGFTDVLAGETKLQDVIRVDEESGAHYITSGSMRADLTGQVDLRKAEAIVYILSKHYDLVIFDTPPLMAVSDALVLSRFFDASVFVAQWGHTRRDAVRIGLRQLLSASGTIGGVVLSQVDVKRNASYSYADSGAYYGQLSHYYAN